MMDRDVFRHSACHKCHIFSVLQDVFDDKIATAATLTVPM